MNKAEAGYSLHYGNAERPLAKIVPDSCWPDMWRIAWPDGRLSDMVNLSRVKDAAAVLAERGPPARNGDRLSWRAITPVGEVLAASHSEVESLEAPDCLPDESTKSYGQSRGGGLMSETELATGHDFVEASHGISPAPLSPESAEPATYGAGIEGVREAANDLSRERQPPDSDEPVERYLEWKSGSKRGQRVNLKNEGFSLTPETAAQTLSQVHETERNLELEPQLANLAYEVDLARSQLAGQQPPDGQQQPAQAETPQPIDSPQPESGEAPLSGLSPKVQAALADPEIRQLIEQPYQAAEQTRQAYSQAAAQIAETSIAGLFASFPELQGLNSQQLPIALQLIERQNPTRRAEIDGHLNRTAAIVAASRQAQDQQRQIDQQRFQQWSKAQDKALEAKVPEIANDPDMKVSRAALKSLKDVGYTEQELADAWNGQPFSMRDHRAQLLIWKAAQYDMARAGIGRPEPKPLPAVQRPGIAPSVGERSAVDLGELRNDFRKATGNDQLRLAVKLQQAQRRARG